MRDGGLGGRYMEISQVGGGVDLGGRGRQTGGVCLVSARVMMTDKVVGGM